MKEFLAEAQNNFGYTNSTLDMVKSISWYAKKPTLGLTKLLGKKSNFTYTAEASH